MNNSNDKVIIELYDNERQVHKYELLDIVNYDDKEYAVMLQEYSLDGEVEIFCFFHSKDKSATLYKPEPDNYIASQVYEMFKEKFQKYYSDRIKFKE